MGRRLMSSRSQPLRITISWPTRFSQSYFPDGESQRPTASASLTMIDPSRSLFEAELAMRMLYMSGTIEAYS
jgi:hypothetical protein